MPQTIALAGAIVVLLLTIGAGIVAHELSHAAVLFVLGIQYDISVERGKRVAGQLSEPDLGSWATVRPREISPSTSTWQIRLAAIAPLILAVPVVFISTGIGQDPLQADNLFVTAWTIGWLACAIPSPRDFSVFWHAEQAVDNHMSEPSGV